MDQKKKKRHLKARLKYGERLCILDASPLELFNQRDFVRRRKGWVYVPKKTVAMSGIRNIIKVEEIMTTT